MHPFVPVALLAFRAARSGTRTEPEEAGTLELVDAMQAGSTQPSLYLRPARAAYPGGGSGVILAAAPLTRNFGLLPRLGNLARRLPPWPVGMRSVEACCETGFSIRCDQVAFGVQFWCSRSRTFARMVSLRMMAVIATLGGFSDSGEGLVFGPHVRIEPDRDQGRHIERLAQMSVFGANEMFAAMLA